MYLVREVRINRPVEREVDASGFGEEKILVLVQRVQAFRQDEAYRGDKVSIPSRPVKDDCIE